MSGSLAEIVNGLRTAQSIDFNDWIAQAFNFLYLDAKVILETQAESDVIAEARFAEEPFYIVIEGQAVLDHNEVGYDKVGQIRGNFSSYMDDRRQKIFKNAYKLVVGRPKFSKDARRRAKPDVSLITAETFIQLLEFHKRFRFSQDDLEVLFRRENEIVYGEVDLNAIRRYLLSQFRRRVETNALVFLCLGASSAMRGWVPTQQVVGMSIAYGRVLKIRVGNEEVMDAITSLQSNLLRLVQRRGDEIRLQSIPIETIKSLIPSGEEISVTLKEFSEHLSRLEEV